MSSSADQSGTNTIARWDHLELTYSASSRPSGPVVHHSARALSLLATHLPNLPDLETLDLTNNSLTVIPTTLLAALLAHPSLTTLILSSNPLGVSPETTNLHALLTSLVNPPSTSQLKSLHLTLTSLTSATAPFLLRLLQAPAPNGLLDLRLNANALSPAKDLRPLLDALKGKTGNRFIQKLEIYGCYDEEDDFQSTVEAGQLVTSLGPYIDRNRRLLRDTREAAKEAVRVGRTVLLARTSDGDGTSTAAETTARRGDGDSVFPLLSLPAELMQPILANLLPGALSQRQVARLIGWLGDRETLERGLDGKALLKEVGCWWWEAGP